MRPLMLASYHELVNANDRMRADWDRRAREDAHFYVAFGRQQQSEEEFLASAAETMPSFEQEFVRLPTSPKAERRALEIGCGPGRLMLPMARHFGEIHGVDISSEMIALAAQRLSALPNAHLHVNSGSDLASFSGEYFDFVYSYIVFQHIPDREAVLNYLREAQRVLKPGGVLRCQLRGSPPIPSELERETETWTGCHFSDSEIAAFAQEHRFPLVAISGVDTQYMWTTFRKPTAVLSQRQPFEATLKAVTAADGPTDRVPARGRSAAVSLWIDAFPHDGDLSSFRVWFNDQEQLGCYLSPVTESGGCQLNSRLPVGIGPGTTKVQLAYDGKRFGKAFEIEVTPAPPLSPTVVAVTDGVNVSSRFRVETGGVKVVMEEIDKPEQVSFRVDGRSPQSVQFECKDPITATFEFAFHLPHRTRSGKQRLEIAIAGRDFEKLELEVI